MSLNRLHANLRIFFCFNYIMVLNGVFQCVIRGYRKKTEQNISLTNNYCRG